jgi:hypothetical protein
LPIVIRLLADQEPFQQFLDTLRLELMLLTRRILALPE